MTRPTSLLEREAVALCRDLIRLDTTNVDGAARGEAAAASLVADQLAEVGMAPVVIEPHPGRTSVVARMKGRSGGGRALLLHGHLDVVPAGEGWSVDPFGGELRDGCVWGRGALDMKGMVATIVAVVRDLARAGATPPHDLVVALLADEEAGGKWGSRWLVENRPDLFDGCVLAISEVGGFSVDLPDGRRGYLVATAEKGVTWLELTVLGASGHAAMEQPDNAVTALGAAVARIGAHRWPARPDAAGVRLLEALGWTAEALNSEGLRTVAPMLAAGLRNTATPTSVDAPSAPNVVPARARAIVDGRFVPGGEADLLNDVVVLAGPGVGVRTLDRADAIEAPTDGPPLDAIAAALHGEREEAAVIPFCLSAGTDNSTFAKLGIAGYGFTPLRLPPGFPVVALFHGPDERVPIDALRFGARVLRRLALDERCTATP